MTSPAPQAGGPFPKPSTCGVGEDGRGWILRDGIAHVVHLANRVASALRMAGHQARIEDMRARILDQNNRWTIEQALEIARDYCDVVDQPRESQ